MAEVLEVRRSGYYAWVKAGNKTKSAIQDDYFLEACLAKLAWVNFVAIKHRICETAISCLNNFEHKKARAFPPKSGKVRAVSLSFSVLLRT